MILIVCFFISLIGKAYLQEQKIDFVYSPLFSNNYVYEQNEGIPLQIKVAEKINLVYIASGFGGIIVLDETGQTKLLQQQTRSDYVNSFVVSGDGMVLVIGQKNILSIFEYPLGDINDKSMKEYIVVNEMTFPSEILEIVLIEDQKVVIAAGINGFIVAYDILNLNNSQQMATFQVDSIQITSIFISQNSKWIYLSCDLIGVVVLEFVITQPIREASFILAAKGQGYRKSWSVVATSDNQYIYEIENWFGIYYANNKELLQSNQSNYPITLQFQPYWPLKQINPVCNVLLISKDNNFLIVGVRSIGILIFNITQKEDIKYFQHIQVNSLSNSAAFSFDENYLYYSNSLSIFTFQISIPNLNNDFPNTFNVHQAIQKEMDGIYKWRCYVDPTNQILIGSFDYSGFYLIPFYNDPLRLQVSQASHLNIETDSMSLDVNNNLLFIPSLYSQKLITIFTIVPTETEPNISLTNPKEIASYEVETVQMAEQLIFSQDRQFAIQTYQNGIFLFDMQIPLKMKLLFYFVNPSFMMGETGGGTITNDNNWIIATVRNYGIYVLDFRDKSNLIMVDYLETLGGESITLSQIFQNYAYLMDGMRGFAVIDLSTLPKITILSRIILIGWTQIGLPINQDNFIIVAQQDNGMLTLIDMKDKTNPFIISTYRRDKQFAVSICLTKDEKFIFIANPQGIITLPLFSNVMIHTEISEIIISQLTGLETTQSIQSNFDQFQNNKKYIFKVGQQIQFNFVILYPVDEDMRIALVNVYESDQIQDLPFYMNYDYFSQILTIDVDKSALQGNRNSQNLNTILIKTVIPMSNQSFIYSIEDEYDTAITDDNQAAQIFDYLMDNNYIDPKSTLTEQYDYSKPFKFNEQFLTQYQLLYSGQADSFQNYIQQLQEKVRQTLVLSFYINPVLFYVERSLLLDFNNVSQPISSVSTNYISVSFIVDIESGKFILKNYPGVITSISEQGDNIKIEGSLININRVLELKIIFANNRSDTQTNRNVTITIIDNINYPLMFEKPLNNCSFIVNKMQLILNKPLQQQIDKQFQDSIVNIQTDISISFMLDSFIVSDVNSIFYKIQLHTSSQSNDEKDDGYKDISPDFWLQSQGNTLLNYYGNIPSNLFQTVFRFKVTANDTYTIAEDFFILNASGVPFFYVVNLLIKILGPLFAIIGIYQKRHIFWNMVLKNYVLFEEEIAICDENFNKKIILLSYILKDSKILVTNLINKINNDNNINMDSPINLKVENSIDNKKNNNQFFSKSTVQMEQERSYTKSRLSESQLQMKRKDTLNENIPKPDFEKIINNLNKVENHIPTTSSEIRYLKNSGCICMKLVIIDIIKNNKNQNVLQGSCDYSSDLKNQNTRIHKAVKAQIARQFLSLDRKSQIVYEFIKSYSLRYLYKSPRFWYKGVIEVDSSKQCDENGQLIIFPQLNLKYEEITLLLISLKLIPQYSQKQIDSLESLIFTLKNLNTGINMYLIREVLFADAYGFTEDQPSSFFPSQGESIHLPYHKIKQILAFKKINSSKWSRPFLSFFNLEFMRYGVSKNIRLPTWLTLDQKHGVIMFHGVPTNEDIDDVLIRIYDLTGYVVKSFMLKVIQNTKRLNQDDDFSIPDEDDLIVVQQQKLYSTNLLQNQSFSPSYLITPKNRKHTQMKTNKQLFRGNSSLPQTINTQIDEERSQQSIRNKNICNQNKISLTKSNQLNYEFKCHENNKNSGDDTQFKENEQFIFNTKETTRNTSYYSNETDRQNVQIQDEIIELII